MTSVLLVGNIKLDHVFAPFCLLIRVFNLFTFNVFAGKVGLHLPFYYLSLCLVFFVPLVPPLLPF